MEGVNARAKCRGARKLGAASGSGLAASAGRWKSLLIKRLEHGPRELWSGVVGRLAGTVDESARQRQVNIRGIKSVSLLWKNE